MENNLKPKILFLVNDLGFFCSHRLPVAEAAQMKGFEIVVGYGDLGSAESSILQNKGIKICFIPMERGGKNIFKDLQSIILIWKLFKSENPDIVHLVTIKPYLYGGIVARLLGISSLVSAVSGLGTIFISNNFKNKFLRLLLYPIFHFAFNHPNQTVIVQNKDDAKLLSSWGVLNPSKVKLIRGSGVDLNDFTALEELDTEPVVCFAARLLADKGIREFVSAAKILKERSVVAKFVIAGSLDQKNLTGLSSSELESIKNEKAVEILGFQNDIPKLFARSHIICLPSYREGLPKVLMEAAAANRAVVTTDVAGCRDAIDPDVSGLLVPVRDDKSLADAIHHLINNPILRKKMGNQARQLAEKEFKIEFIIDAHMKIYENIIISAG